MIKLLNKWIKERFGISDKAQARIDRFKELKWKVEGKHKEYYVCDCGKWFTSKKQLGGHKAWHTRKKNEQNQG